MYQKSFTFCVYNYQLLDYLKNLNDRMTEA